MAVVHSLYLFEASSNFVVVFGIFGIVETPPALNGLYRPIVNGFNAKSTLSFPLRHTHTYTYYNGQQRTSLWVSNN